MKSESSNSGSAFADIVEQLSTRLADSAEYGRTAPSLSGLAAQPIHEPAYVSPSNLSQIYETTLSHYGRSIPAPAPVVAPAPAPVVAAEAVPLPSIDPKVIARELKLRRWHSIEQLLEIRRRFAKTNHPDRVENEIRDAATARMGIANTMIDEAIAARDSVR